MFVILLIFVSLKLWLHFQTHNILVDKATAEALARHQVRITKS